MIRRALVLTALLAGCEAQEFPVAQMGGVSQVDLTADVSRQVVVDRDSTQYLGHPSTLLLEDGKTILVVYPEGHGRGPIVYKRSTDAGQTWSERLAVPESWASSQEVPTLFRTVDAAGVKRIVMFSGLYPVRTAVSEDDGETWSELEPIGDFGGIVAMGSVERLTDGRYLAFFHDDGRFIGPEGEAGQFYVYGSESSDGGLTWSAPRVLVTDADVDLCEPGVVRSPDGTQLAMLLRENSRTQNSFLTVSEDEGASWSAHEELPLALTGDRHTLRYLPDGRLIVVFRDMAEGSDSKGDWVAWVGTYEEIMSREPAGFRIRIMDNQNSWDSTYPGVEVLPNGDVVTTTYGHWVDGEPPYIVSVRLTWNEMEDWIERYSMGRQ